MPRFYAGSNPSDASTGAFGPIPKGLWTSCQLHIERYYQVASFWAPYHPITNPTGWTENPGPDTFLADVAYIDYWKLDAFHTGTPECCLIVRLDLTPELADAYVIDNDTSGQFWYTYKLTADIAFDDVHQVMAYLNKRAPHNWSPWTVPGWPFDYRNFPDDGPPYCVHVNWLPPPDASLDTPCNYTDSVVLSWHQEIIDTSTGSTVLLHTIDLPVAEYVDIDGTEGVPYDGRYEDYLDHYLDHAVAEELAGTWHCEGSYNRSLRTWNLGHPYKNKVVTLVYKQTLRPVVAQNPAFDAAWHADLQHLDTNYPWIPVSYYSKDGHLEVLQATTDKHGDFDFGVLPSGIGPGYLLAGAYVANPDYDPDDPDSSFIMVDPAAPPDRYKNITSGLLNKAYDFLEGYQPSISDEGGDALGLAMSPFSGDIGFVTGREVFTPLPEHNVVAVLPTRAAPTAWIGYDCTDCWPYFYAPLLFFEDGVGDAKFATGWRAVFTVLDSPVGSPPVYRANAQVKITDSTGDTETLTTAVLLGIPFFSPNSIPAAQASLVDWSEMTEAVILTTGDERPAPTTYVQDVYHVPPLPDCPLLTLVFVNGAGEISAPRTWFYLDNTEPGPGNNAKANLSADIHNDVLTLVAANLDATPGVGQYDVSAYRNLQARTNREAVQADQGWEAPVFIKNIGSAAQLSATYLNSGRLLVSGIGPSRPGGPEQAALRNDRHGGEAASDYTPTAAITITNTGDTASRVFSVGRAQGMVWAFHATANDPTLSPDSHGDVPIGSVYFSFCRDNFEAWQTSSIGIGARGPYGLGAFLGNGYGVLYTHEDGTLHFKRTQDPSTWSPVLDETGADVSDLATGITAQIAGGGQLASGTLVGLTWEWDGHTGERTFRSIRSLDLGVTWQQEPFDVDNTIIPAQDRAPAFVVQAETLFACWLTPDNQPVFAATFDGGVTWTGGPGSALRRQTPARSQIGNRRAIRPSR